MLPLLRFFCEKTPAVEINRLDKIARRSKRVGGAIADLWGGQYQSFSSGLTVEKSSWTEKSISRGLYISPPLTQLDTRLRCFNTRKRRE